MSPDTRPGAPNATRGIVIVVIAGLIGVFLLSRGGTTTVLAKDKTTPAHATTTVPSVPSIAPETSTTAPSTTTPPAQVSVAIFNATGGAVVGAAGNNKAKLTPLGYTQVSIFDTTPTDESAVYYADGSQADAQAIAQVLGINADAVSAASSATNIPAQGQGMAVVVVIGKDAGSTTD